MPRVAPALSLAALACFGSFLAGCGGSGSNANGCGTHEYSYVGGGIAYSGGTGWYGGGYDDGWYDPADDGTDYAYESAGANGDGSGGDNGSYGDGSGDGSGDDGTYDNGSDDGSGDDGSNDDSSDDGSGDDGTASKKHLHTTSVPLHTSGVSAHANACFAYSCDLMCAVGSPATTEREALGYSAISASDACDTAAHGVETWAHDSLGANVTACRLAGSNVPSSSTMNPNQRTPATPAVSGGFSTPSGSGPSKSANLPRIR